MTRRIAIVFVIVIIPLQTTNKKKRAASLLGGQERVRVVRVQIIIYMHRVRVRVIGLSLGFGLRFGFGFGFRSVKALSSQIGCPFLTCFERPDPQPHFSACFMSVLFCLRLRVLGLGSWVLSAVAFSAGGPVTRGPTATEPWLRPVVT